MHELRLSNAELGRRIGVSGQMASLYRTGAIPGSDKLGPLAKALGVSEEYLSSLLEADDSAPRRNTDELVRVSPTLFEEPFELHVFTHVSPKEEEEGVIYGNGERKILRLPREFVTNLVGFLPPQEVGVMFVQGDGMSPTLEVGDMVIYEPIRSIIESGVYTVLIDGHLVARRVDPIPGGGFVVIKDNKYAGYADDRIVPGELGPKDLRNAETQYEVDFRPVGRVLWPKRSTDRVHVKQVAEIIRTLMRNGSSGGFRG